MTRSVDASEALSISTDDDRGVWTITTPRLDLRLARGTDGDVRLASLRAGDRELIAKTQPLFTVGSDRAMGESFETVTSRVAGNMLRLAGTLVPSSLTVRVALTVHAAASVVEIDLEIANDSLTAITVGSLPTLGFRTARVSDGQLVTLNGGRWDEAVPPRGYRLELRSLDEIGRATAFGAADDGRSSGEQVPWFALTHPEGGLLAGLVWSGRWRLAVTPHGGDNAIAFGISDFSHVLGPAERVSLPSVVVAGYEGDLDDGANAWRQWLADHWMPPVPEDWPWIQYNHWYAYYGDIDAARLLDEARLAAESACEVFVIDDGWFRGRRPESYYAGWGDWVEDRSRFPDGIRAFGEQVRALGMRFGLWVEPERADDRGDLVREHPAWVATRGGEPIRRPGPAGPEGVHLCLGNPDVRRWMAGDMIRVVREYGVDWLKWDYNMGYGLGCDAGDHGHQSTDGHRAHTLGLYQVLQDLRDACPNLMIENCASGGHRVDLGTLRHTHTSWVSDYTHRAASCRQHVQGAGFFLPLTHLNTWTLEDRDTTGFRSRMGGAFGVSSYMGDWSAAEREAFRGAVAEYTRLRPYLEGDRYLLTGPWHGAWGVWQLSHPTNDGFTLLAFHDHGAVPAIRVTPRVPAPDRLYRVEFASGASFDCAGADLATDGIAFELPSGGSEIAWASVVD